MPEPRVTSRHLAWLISDVRDAVRGTNDRLDSLNGRTRKAEQALAVLHERTDSVEKALTKASNASATQAGQRAAIVAAVLASAITMFGQWVLR